MSTRGLIVIHGKSGPPGYVYIPEDAHPETIVSDVEGIDLEAKTNRQLARKLEYELDYEAITPSDAKSIAGFADYIYELQARSGRIRIRSCIFPFGFPGAYEREGGGEEYLHKILGRKSLGE